MSQLIVVGFPNESAGFALRAALAEIQSEYLVDMDDIVVVTRTDKGKVKLHQAANLTAAGAVNGSFWGLLIGMIFFNPLFGAALGAGLGALSGKLSDLGVSDDFVRSLGETLPAGGSAVFILVRNATPDRVLERLEPFRGKGVVLQTSLTRTDEDQLRAFLDGVEAPVGGA